MSCGRGGLSRAPAELGAVPGQVSSRVRLQPEYAANQRVLGAKEIGRSGEMTERVAHEPLSRYSSSGNVQYRLLEP